MCERLPNPVRIYARASIRSFRARALTDNFQQQPRDVLARADGSPRIVATRGAKRGRRPEEAVTHLYDGAQEAAASA